ncbi:Serine/arginine-rich SC35-like splicing factor SCL30 [Zea mays]|uniref:Serine/arginine-rich SC35-like splicing factor SCL30 n=1 Tax=Zea mays TaxID=4577 RepID=A0A317YB69_MAIZE|nr:Serine/arginine-rich SC35-like splicing factor SCL30 [Zea mays]
MPGKGRSAYKLSYQGTGARPITHHVSLPPSALDRTARALRSTPSSSSSGIANRRTPPTRPQATAHPLLQVSPRRRRVRFSGHHRAHQLTLIFFSNFVRAEDLRVPFERFGPVRDVYIPKDYYSGEPRGFAFVEFVDPYDASEAQYHMNRQVFFGREIAVVLAAESRKRPEEMRSRTRVRGYSGHEGRRSSYYGNFAFLFSYHPCRSYSPAPRRGNDYSASPRRQEAHRSSPPRRPPKEHDEDKKRRSYSPASRDDADNVYEKRSPPADSDGSPLHRRSPKEYSGSPPGSRSRSADESPVASD